MGEHVELIIKVAGTFFSLLIIIISYIGKKQIDRIDDCEKKTQEIKGNYLERFEEIKESISELKIIVVHNFDKQEKDTALLAQKIQRRVIRKKSNIIK